MNRPWAFSGLSVDLTEPLPALADFPQRVGDVANTPENVEGRVRAAGTSVSLDVNCASFAYFVAGLIDVETAQDPHDIFLQNEGRLLAVNHPQIGDLVGWETREKLTPGQRDKHQFVHWAIVGSTEPLTIHHRKTGFSPVETCVPFEEALSLYSEQPCNVRLFRVVAR